ncbi:hypothetical protein Pd630_LPD02012 [Rhodococcus opacus PD630]|nr:hypothetical protein Pd630_LPD02012 [Rhodococcus opacus PD630]
MDTGSREAGCSDMVESSLARRVEDNRLGHFGTIASSW